MFSAARSRVEMSFSEDFATTMATARPRRAKSKISSTPSSYVRRARACRPAPRRLSRPSPDLDGEARLRVCSPAKRGGAIAQLGERVNGIHEVAGSNPASSTNPS
mgnify:CR=1 FL=1